MIGNAQVIYAEILQLNDIALKYRHNYEFWRLMYEALADEKVAFLDDMGTYKHRQRDIRRKIKRNEKGFKKTRARIEILKHKYKQLTKGEVRDE